MTCCAVLLCKDERDVIEYTLRHLAGQVDEIIVSDNASTDGTREMLDELYRHGVIDMVLDDPDPAYMQSEKTTALADIARERGHDWVCPVDADEWWATENGMPIRDYLLSLAPDVQACQARLFHYLPTADDPDDPDDPDPFRRIGWRLAHSGSAKMAARLRDGLVIEMGNHSVTFDGRRPMLDGGGLLVRHYSWRSAEQYTKKLRNGARAYLARPDIESLPASVGTHWRMFGDPEAPDFGERTADHFRQWFWAPNPPCAPGSDDPAGLVYDPAVADD